MNNLTPYSELGEAERVQEPSVAQETDESDGPDWRWLIVVALTLASFCAYWPVRENKFINFDDNKYVTENVYVTSGLTVDNVIWALGARYAANWHPLTWISHQLDVQLYGLEPRGHHFTNVLLHCANTLLLFLLLCRMTKAQWRAAFVAGLFALHPLHVESVAWVSERKDVLSAFFFMLTLWAYAAYAQRENLPAFLATLGLYALGLMAKPMLVSLPLVLLLLDYWPLRRIRREGDWREMLLEKLPFVLLAAASCAVTLYVQDRGEAVRSLSSHPIPLRIENAVIAYAEYLRKTILPDDLAVFYPYRFKLPWNEVAIATAVFGTLSAVAWLARRRMPYIFVGWLWFVIMLLPAIGLVQVGQQSMADRYAYLPLIGVFIAVAWSLGAFARRYPALRLLLAAACVVALATCAVRTNIETRYWRSSITLFAHAARVTQDNWLAYYNKGTEELADGLLNDAIRSYDDAIRVRPDYTNAYLNRGIARMRLNLNAEAEADFREIIRQRPSHADAHLNLATVLYRQKRYVEAVEAYRELLRIEPERAAGHYSLGLALKQLGKKQEAREEYEKALGIDPEYDDAKRALEQLETEGDAVEESAEDGDFEATETTSAFSTASSSWAPIWSSL